MKPNVLLMGFKTDWLSDCPQAAHNYIGILQWVLQLTSPIFEFNSTVHMVMVGYAAVVSCQSSQVRCVFQRCIWPTVWSWGAQDEGETGCFSTISITWWTISLWDWLKTAMGWAFSLWLLCKCSQESLCSKCLCPYFSEFRLWWKSREYSHHLCSTSH